MKRQTVMLAAFMFLLVQSLTYGETTVSMSPSSVESPAVGQQLSFSIKITGGLDVKSCGLTVRFDSTALSYVSITPGGYFGSEPTDFTITTDDKVTYSAAASAGVDGDGTIATVTFTVLEVKDSTLTLGASLGDSSSHTIDTTVEGATITSPQTPGLSIRVVSSPGSGNPGDELTFTVEVQEDGSAASGKTVSFSITSGDGNASLSPESATTDTDGQASTTITLGNNAAGNYIVAATVDSESVSSTAKVIPPPAKLSMSPSSVESPAVGQQLSFSIKITGGLDVKSCGLTVRFDSTALSYVSITPGGYFGSEPTDFTITTDDKVTYSAAASAGVDGDGTIATVTFTVLEVKDSTLTLGASLGDSSSHTIDTTVEGATITSPTVSPTGISISVASSPGSGNPGDELTFTVEVQEDGSAASGKTVAFSINSGDGNASLNPASATTDANGQASTTITLANNAAGNYIVTATVDSESVNSTAKVIPPPAKLSMSPSS
ncbi:MAG: cohesin domain-containing protein, partial [Candidatus Poribacteria bacterium]|nr:cohesin domain-containing protein [Candidatus Poribacteria bacterium]